MHGKSPVKASRVGLAKEQVGCTFNLHKLPGEGLEASVNDVLIKWNSKGGKPLLPMPPELFDDVSDGGFINKGIRLHDWLDALARQIGIKYIKVVF